MESASEGLTRCMLVFKKRLRQSIVLLMLKDRKTTVGSFESDGCDIAVMNWDDRIAVRADVCID
jgi:hypothetical protein